jgi:hypothetical protein
VTFLVEGRAFPAHRCWVAAFSQPLGAMFRSGMRESQEARVVLRDTDAGAFQLMLDFIYGGPVQLDQENIECVLELSVRFALGVLIEQCCNFLASAVAVDTACAILILADVRACLIACLNDSTLTNHLLGLLTTPWVTNHKQKYDCRPLRRDTLLFVVAHLPRCWASAREHFARLPKALLVEVLSHDALVHGEILAFQAAVFWLDEQRRLLLAGEAACSQGLGEEEDEEACLVEEVLSHVRFPHMPARLLVEEVEGHPVMQREVSHGVSPASSYGCDVLTDSSLPHSLPLPQACKRFVLEAFRYQAVLQCCASASSSAAAHYSKEQQEILRKFAEEMGDRARPRRLLPHAAPRRLALPPAGADEDDDDAGQHELLLSSSCSAVTAAAITTSTITTTTTHQLVGPAEAVEPPLQQPAPNASKISSSGNSSTVAAAAGGATTSSGSSDGSSASSSMLQYALITTVERHKGDGATSGGGRVK